MILRRWILPAASDGGGCADDGHREIGPRKENKSDFSQKRFLEVGMILLMALLLDSTMMECLMVNGERLCLPDESTQTVECKAAGSDASCRVSPYERDNCYSKFYECWIRDIPYKHNTSIINGQLFTDIVISVPNETSWSVVIWTIEPEGWWLMDSKHSDEVLIFGLPGNISTKEPPKLFNASGCLGCPPPIFQWFPSPKRHQLQFSVQKDNMSGFSSNTEVIFVLYSSNETNFSRSCDNYSQKSPLKDTVKSYVDEVFRVPDVYSREFCAHFHFNKNGVDREYFCGRTIDMSVYPDEAIHGEIPIPLWMKFIPAFVMVLMVSLAIFLFGTVKGWFNTPLRRRILINQPISSVTAASDSPPDERKQQITSSIEEQTPFLNINGLGPI